MDSLISPDLKVTSRGIAAHFNKRHSDLLRMIENFKRDGGDEDFNQRNIALVEYLDAKGELRKSYTMTEEAALIIVGRMTGPAAAAVQIGLAKAFTAMKRTIKDHRLKADAETKQLLADARATVQAYENLLESKAATLAKLLNIAPSKTRPYFSKLVELGVLEEQEKLIRGFAYRPTPAGEAYISHTCQNGIIHWKPEVLSLLRP